MDPEQTNTEELILELHCNEEHQQIARGWTMLRLPIEHTDIKDDSHWYDWQYGPGIPDEMYDPKRFNYGHMWNEHYMRLKK